MPLLPLKNWCKRLSELYVYDVFRNYKIGNKCQDIQTTATTTTQISGNSVNLCMSSSFPLERKMIILLYHILIQNTLVVLMGVIE